MSSAFVEAAREGKLSDLQQMLRENPAWARTAEDNGVPALMVALYYGQPEAAELIASHRKELSVYEAAALGRLDTLEALIGAGHNLNTRSSDGFTALQLACYFGQKPAAERLLGAGSDPQLVSENPMQLQAIHAASACRDSLTALHMVAMLLDAGADPKARQQMGFVPLHAAAQNNNVELARLLIESGADPYAATDDDRTARTFAESNGADEVLALLG